MSVNDESFTRFIEQLQLSPFFGSLSDESLTLLVSQARQINFQVNDMIFIEGESSLGLYWLQSGTLKAVKYSASGKEQVLHFINAGDTFNEVGCFTSSPNPVSVVALESGQLWHIPRDVIRKHIQQDPDFALLTIDILSDRLRQSVALIEDLSLRSVVNRLARLILDESEGDELLRPPWYTQHELAARLGTVADVVQRSLRKLEAENLIAVDRQSIRVVNRPKLEDVAK
jgi:CRP-like cAMP-binding protein